MLLCPQAESFSCKNTWFIFRRSRLKFQFCHLLFLCNASTFTSGDDENICSPRPLVIRCDSSLWKCTGKYKLQCRGRYYYFFACILQLFLESFHSLVCHLVCEKSRTLIFWEQQQKKSEILFTLIVEGRFALTPALGIL